MLALFFFPDPCVLWDCILSYEASRERRCLIHNHLAPPLANDESPGWPVKRFPCSAAQQLGDYAKRPIGFTIIQLASPPSLCYGCGYC